jgi:translation initiation factor IF-3
VKEIRVRPKTGEHDVDIKASQARKFLERQDKVLVTVPFRGREMQHQEEGRRILDLILEKLADATTLERPRATEGRRMTAPLTPKPGAKGQARATAKPADR